MKTLTSMPGQRGFLGISVGLGLALVAIFGSAGIATIALDGNDRDSAAPRSGIASAAVQQTAATPTVESVGTNPGEDPWQVR